MRCRSWALLSLVSGLSGSMSVVACADGEPRAALGETAGALVYGADDRREHYALSDAKELRLADATAVVLSTPALTVVTGGYVIDTSTTYGEDFELCADEPYRDQPDPGWCSAFAVGPDLVATAGHCVKANTCASTWFVFGFRMEDAATVRATVPTEDVYRCTKVVARSQKNGDDYAVVRVDRAITGKPLLHIRRTGDVQLGDAVVVSGHPGGIPLKVAGNASVMDVGPATYFQANIDTYGGNSGSPVMNAATGVVEGVLVRGNPDYDYDAAGACYRSNVCPDSGCPTWEEASKTTRFAADVPALVSCTSHAQCADATLCNGVEVCDFEVCRVGTPVSCAAGQVCNPGTGACETPACGAVDAACTRNRDCCSNKCKNNGRCK